MVRNDYMYRVKEGIIGNAIGDSFGVATKGQSREYLLNNPVLKMLPSIKKGIPKGSWSDCTSLMISTMNAISKKDLDYNFIAESCVSWFVSNKYCSVSESFGIGKTTLKALMLYTKREKPAYECGIDGFENNGNSSLKMMLPLAFYFTARKSSKVEVYDAKGCRVFAAGRTCEIDLSPLPVGTYVVRILQAGGGVSLHRIAKQ